MGSKQKEIVIVAGEASGDLHAANLVKALKIIDPTLSFSGLGGEKMRQEGVVIIEDLTKLAVVGFVEILKHYTEIKKMFTLIIEKIIERKIETVILIDYPGFNLRLAKKLKHLGIKVIYYISPQVWAWKKSRIEIIRRFVDHMIVVFPFEKSLYQEHGIHVDYSGHPLSDEVKATVPREKFLAQHSLDLHTKTIGLLPGSREKEIELILPPMIKTAEKLKQKYPTQFILIQAPTIPTSLLSPLLAQTKVPITVINSRHYNAINACDCCMVASGTATLETALLNKPMVIIYKTSFLTWALAKLFVKIPNIGLVNVVAGKKIVPECIQHNATPKKIYLELEALITDHKKCDGIQSELRRVKDLLGESGATARIASSIYKYI